MDTCNGDSGGALLANNVGVSIVVQGYSNNSCNGDSGGALLANNVGVSIVVQGYQKLLQRLVNNVLTPLPLFPINWNLYLCTYPCVKKV